MDVICDGGVVDVDLGKAGSDFFANVASIGFSADIARQTSRTLKSRFGVAAYALSGVKNLLTRHAFRCTLTLDGETHTFRTHQVIVANGSFFGVTRVAPDSAVGDRQLMVYTLDTVSR